VRPRLLALVPFVPALFVGAVIGWWEWSGGGFDPGTWYPGALFLVLLAATVCATRMDLLRSLSRTVRLAAAALVAYAVWSAISIAWATDKGTAWDGANRTLFYAVVFVLVAMLPWTGRSALVALGAFAAVTAAVAAATVDAAASSGDPLSFFNKARLDNPLGYTNATAVLFLSAFWVAAGLAARRRLPFAARTAMLGCAGVLLGVALLCQSRGGALTFPIVAAIFFALAKDRLRCFVALLLAASVVALNSGPLLDVYDGLSHGKAPHPLLVAAQHAVVGIFLELLVVGVLWALLDARVTLPERLVHWTGRIVLWVVVAAVVVGGVASVALPAPRHKIAHAWHQFRHNELPQQGGTAHFSAGLGSNRYDFWRVAVGEFRRHPLNGIGVDNFANDYTVRRQSDEEPLYPHSLEIRTLSQTGIVGALLLGTFLVLGTLAGLRARRLGGETAAAAPLALVVFADWLVHGSVDWFWEWPVLGLVAIGALALATSLGTQFEREARLRRRRLPASLAGIAVALVTAALVVSLALPLLAVRETNAAVRDWHADPKLARTELDRANSLNPLSVAPDYAAAAIATRLGDWAWMDASLRDAIARDPDDWYSHFYLGLVEDVLHHRPASLAALRRAHALNPREPLVQAALQEVRTGKTVSIRSYDNQLIQRNASLSH
jgi:hypothetical protein